MGSLQSATSLDTGAAAAIIGINMAKVIPALLLSLVVIFCYFEQSLGTTDAVDKLAQDGCLTCVEDIMKAVADCQGDDVNILECITEALGAASDCVHCICEILQIIGGYDLNEDEMESNLLAMSNSLQILDNDENLES